MRELKFRAWDEELSCWVDPLYVFIGMDGVLLENGSMSYRRKYIIEQFTGLLDKNGKEIYEGDIIEWYPRSKRAKSQVEVTYEAPSFFFGDWYEGDMPATNENCVVVGNIHANSVDGKGQE